MIRAVHSFVMFGALHRPRGCAHGRFLGAMMGLRLIRTLGPAVLALAAAGGDAAAQGAPPYGGPPAPNQACVRLESHLAAIDRGSADPARAEQVRRFEEAARQQQFDLERL